MEPAIARAPLIQRLSHFGKAPRGRLGAALLLFAGLSGCARDGAPMLTETWRIGLGALSLAVDAQGAALAVACSRSNDVWVLNLADGSLRHRIDTLPRPRAVLFHPERELFFVAEGLSSVAQVRLEDQRVARRVRPRSRVSRLAYEPVRERLFGAHQGLPTLGVYRLRDMHLESSLAVGGEVSDLAFGDGDAWLVTRQADALVRLTLIDLSVKASVLAGPEPRGLDLLTGLDRALVACHGRKGEASPLALPTPVPSPDTLAPAAPEGEEPGPEAALAEAEPSPLPSGGRHWDGGGLAVYRLSDVRRLDYIELPGGPMAVMADAQGRRAAVACADGKLRIVDLEKRKVLHSMDLGGRPGAVQRHPDGRHLLIALQDQKALLKVLPGVDW
jgi:hypothetical protein